MRYDLLSGGAELIALSIDRAKRKRRGPRIEFSKIGGRKPSRGARELFSSQLQFVRPQLTGLYGHSRTGPGDIANRHCDQDSADRQCQKEFQ